MAQVPFEKAKHLICLYSDLINVSGPPHIVTEIHSQVWIIESRSYHLTVHCISNGTGVVHYCADVTVVAQYFFLC